MADTKTKTNETKTSINTNEKISQNKDFNNLDSLFNQEKELVNSMKDEQMKKIAQDEYDEMINRYKEEREKVKSDIKKESKLILDDLKKEFSSDIKSVEKINKLDFLSSLDGFDTFKNLISAKEKNGGLPDSIKEQLLNIFENADDADLESYFTMELGSNIVDLKGAKDFIEYFKKSTGLYKEEVNKILNLDFEKLSDNEKEYYLKEINKYKEQISADKRKELEEKLKIKTSNDIIKTSNDAIKVDIDSINKALKFNEGLEKIKAKFSGVLNEKINTILKIHLSDSTNLENHQKATIDLMKELTQNKALFHEFIQAIPEKERKVFLDNFESFVKTNIDKNPSKENTEILSKFQELRKKEEDKVIDGGTTKIVGENGYKLEVTYSSTELQKIMQDPINVMSNKERAEFTDKKIELKTQINELDDKIKSLDDTIEKVKLLKELQKNPEANKENIKKLEEILGKIEILKQVNSLEELESKKYELIKNKEEKVSELEKVEKDFNDELESRFKEKSIDGYKDEEKTRGNLKFLESIGITIINKEIIDKILNFVNLNLENPGVKELGLESPINLKEIDFSKTDSETNSKKLAMMKLVNKILTGTLTDPLKINENNIISNLDLKDDINKIKRKEGDNNFNSSWNYNIMENNLTLKEKETTNKETK